MRVILALVLIGLLASCPIVCGTAGASGRDGLATASGKAPLPVPANDDDCLCNGAVCSIPSGGDFDGFPLDLPCLPLGILFGLPSAVLSTGRSQSPLGRGQGRREDIRQAPLRC